MDISKKIRTLLATLIISSGGIYAVLSNDNLRASVFSFLDVSYENVEDENWYEDTNADGTDETFSDEAGYEANTRHKSDDEYYLKKEWEEKKQIAEDRDHEWEKMYHQLEECRTDNPDAEVALEEWARIVEEMHFLLREHSHYAGEEVLNQLWELNGRLEEEGHFFWNALEKCHEATDTDEIEAKAQYWEKRRSELKKIKEKLHQKAADGIADNSAIEVVIKCHALFDEGFAKIDAGANIDELHHFNGEIDACIGHAWEMLEKSHSQANTFDAERPSPASDDFWQYYKKREQVLKDFREKEQKLMQNDVYDEDVMHCIDTIERYLADMKQGLDEGNDEQTRKYDNMIEEKIRKCQPIFEDRIFHNPIPLPDAPPVPTGLKSDDTAQEPQNKEDKTATDWQRPEVDEDRLIKRNFHHTLKEIVHEQARLLEMEEAGKVLPEAADHCAELMEKAEAIITSGLDAAESGDKEVLQKTKHQMKQIEPKVRQVCKFLFGNQGFIRPDVDGFVDEDFAGSEKENMKAIIAQIRQEVMQEVMHELSALEPLLLDRLAQKFGSGFQQQTSDFFEVIPHIPQAHQDEFVQKKADILQQMEELKALKEKLQAEHSALQNELNRIEAVKDRIAGYNFYGQAGDRMEQKIDAFLARSENLSDDDFRAAVEQLEQEADQEMNSARHEKYQSGIIPFLDTDDHNWFTPYIDTLKKQGVISGKRDASGNIVGYDPSGQVTFAEALKIALEAAGVGPAHTAAGNHWAAGYQQRAEEYGITLNNNMLDRPAKRGDVITLLVKLGGLETVESDASSCPDVATDNVYFKYVETAKQLGLISGDGDTGNCRPNDPIDRAETAKIANGLLDMTQ